MLRVVQFTTRVALGSGKEDPVLQKGNIAWLLQQRQIFSRILVASTLALALSGASAAAQTVDSKKPGLETTASSSPASRSDKSEAPAKPGAAAQSLPKPETARSVPSSKSLESPAKMAGGNSGTTPSETRASDKSALPFPLISGEAVSAAAGVQPVTTHYFPSAIDIRGSADGILLHARRETRYDLLSPLSIWLEEGPLLVSVKAPSEMVLVATKFGDVCVTTGGIALVERGEEDTLRIVNLCTNGDTVYLNMHDKLWTNSPWGHTVKVHQLNDKKGKKRTYENIESGAVAITPGYELVLSGRSLTMEDVKPTDSIGRRDFKTFEGGHIVVSEISVDNLTQLHDLVKNLNNHGEKASSVFAEIMKNAGQLKARQGESGFEKNVPAPPKPPEPRRKPPNRVPPAPGKAPAARPKTPPPSANVPAPPAPASAKGGGLSPTVKPESNGTSTPPK